MARVGKIARMPVEVREELCRRLQNGEMGPQLLPWLNGLPEAVAVLQEHFGGQAVNAQNLSDWRNGGFKDWQARQDKKGHIREMAAYAADLARANGASLAEGASAIASGRILELLEAVDGKMDMEELKGIIAGLAALRAEDTKSGRLEVQRERLKQLDEALRLEKAKFSRTTCELFLKWYEDEQAKGIAGSAASNAEKIERLGELMFGDDWDQAGKPDGVNP